MTALRRAALVAVVLFGSQLLACSSTNHPAPVSPGPDAGETVDPAPVAKPVTIKWATASEVDNFGFDVYRGDDPEGPFVRLTDEPVEGAGTSDDENRYRFVDDTVEPNRVYYYYVESISMAGVREQFTPVGEVKAKPASPEDSAPDEPDDELPANSPDPDSAPRSSR